MVKIEKVNPFALKKSELQDYLTKRCKHGHIYCEHPACYIKESGRETKIGYLDIETSNLKADFGVMLSYCIKEKGKSNILGRAITKKELENDLDKDLVNECIQDMLKFDVVITYYGTRFDIPFIRSRALWWKLDFPIFGYLKHKDVYYMVRNKLCLSRNRLDNACRLFGIEGKTHLDGTYWIKALTGDKKSLKYILDHNKADVEILEKLHEEIKDYVRNINRSI